MSIDPEIRSYVAQFDQALGGPLHRLEPAVLRAITSRAGPVTRPPDVTVSDRLVSHAGREVRVRIYRPGGAWRVSRRALLFFHGGGWVIGSVDSYDDVAADIASAARCTVISVDYSLAPEHPYPAAMRDGEAVAEWFGTHAAELGVDPAYVAIGGDSAGGNLAAALCVGYRDRGRGVPFRFQWLLYPALDVDIDRPSYRSNAEAPILGRDTMIWFLRQYLGDGWQAPDVYAAPCRAGDLAGLPPAFIHTASFDPLHDEGVEFAERLRVAGVRCSHRNACDLVHGFIRMRNISARARIEFAAACAALDEGLS
ncbi:alpha/beta hydrolase [Burkholderia sp. Ac-20353]|uniref:alpha/beta hydrolase n=1 Tax=Burkholderia sp. Ac-20353 TaxID=2703894 RepID=UPI00197BA0CC|nr:alpha/beta hydrolase [Burkholderia sp. Ac-20353]MBN3785960.1 alpha/beta hydrolase [Burkholderia sp. Ac-20353]